jgi:integrase
MRNKAIFTVFARKLESNKVVYYYQCYDDFGKRLNAHSTGMAKKTQAVAFCMELFRAGNLIPRLRVPSFAEFSQNWFDPDKCEYLKWRKLYGEITQNTITIYKNNLENHLKPFFDKMNLAEITPLAVQNWMGYMAGKELSNATINQNLATLKIMMGEAARRNLLKTNPVESVKPLKADNKNRVIFTPVEVKELFLADWKTVWDNSLVYMLNKVAAITGMRLGELLGLRWEDIHEDYISVCGQYTKFGYTSVTKTKEHRDIPVPNRLILELSHLLGTGSRGFLFSDDGGEKPISRTMVYTGFKAALEKIGIQKEEREERGLTVHCWRHFLNTTLRVGNIADSKVQGVTGHKTDKETERYTHFNTREFSDVRKVQTKLLDGPKAAKPPKKADSKQKPGKGKGAKKAAGKNKKVF